jgi:glucans biosynthesis protein
MIHRRDVLKSAVLLTTLCNSAPHQALGSEPGRSSAPRAFDFATLKGQARALALQPWKEPAPLAPAPLTALNYDQYQAIRFRHDHGLWATEDRGFRVEFFHMGRGFKEPVRMYEVVQGQAREILYNPEMFNFTNSGVKTGSLRSDLAFAGFRLLSATNWEADVAAFLGASYFRAVGSDARQFGLSARGLAIDTAIDGAEEFPRFTSFWFERPPQHARTLVLYGLLDSPSVTGAYRFEITPGVMQIMEVDSALYPRKLIGRLGIAPLTSMYQCGENDRRVANDWRPEIHDSDGLSMWTGKGEWIWRPLVNPDGVRVNSYTDENPRGFGLLQRDREFNNYQDDGVFYHRRPSLWITPKNKWGAGAVQLVELPAADETFDNIVAFWHPTNKPKPGDEMLMNYRMHWGSQPPNAPPLGQAIATRTGIGGVIGQPRRYFSWRFAIDFEGGELAGLPKGAQVQPVITASRGKIEITSARPLEPVDGYRAMFDVKPTDDSLEPIDLRLYLRSNGQPLTETWIYQWTPPTMEERRRALVKAGY